MKRLFVFLMMAWLLVVPVHAKSAEIQSVELNATLTEDGNVQIEEVWNVEFEGLFEKFKRNIPIASDDQFSNPQVFIDGQALRQDPNFPTHFSVDEDSRDVVINIVNKNMSGRKEFRIVYDIMGAIHRYQDVAEFNYHLLGDQWDYPIPHLKGTVRYPVVGKDQPLYVWTHSKADEEVLEKTESQVFIQASDVGKYQGLNVRMALPSQLFPNLKVQAGNQLGAMIEEEEKLLEKEKRQSIQTVIVYGLILAASGWIIKRAHTHRKRIIHSYQPTFEPQYFDHLPSNLTPAEVIGLLNYEKNQYDDDQIYVSTLLSLAQKGLISIDIQNDEAIYTLHPVKLKTLNLKPHEISFFDFLSECMDKKTSLVTNDSIECYGKRHPREANEYLTDVENAVDESLEEQGYYGHIKKPLAYIIMTAAFIACAFFLIFVRPLAGMIGVSAGIYGLVVVAISKGCSQKGDDEAALWVAFDNYLHSLKSHPELRRPTLEEWNEFLPYGVAFGYGEDILSYLPELYHEFYDSDLYRYGYYRCFYYNRMFTPSSLAAMDVIQETIHSVNVAASSGGGSFSGGGGISGGGGGSFS